MYLQVYKKTSLLILDNFETNQYNGVECVYRKTLTETVGPHGRPQRAGEWWKPGVGTAVMKITPELQTERRDAVGCAGFPTVIGNAYVGM